MAIATRRMESEQVTDDLNYMTMRTGLIWWMDDGTGPGESNSKVSSPASAAIGRALGPLGDPSETRRNRSAVVE